MSDNMLDMTLMFKGHIYIYSYIVTEKKLKSIKLKPGVNSDITENYY